MPSIKIKLSDVIDLELLEIVEGDECRFAEINAASKYVNIICHAIQFDEEKNVSLNIQLDEGDYCIFIHSDDEDYLEEIKEQLPKLTEEQIEEITKK